MPDHKFPLQMECLALAVQSTAVEMSTSDAGEDDHTKMILKRASAFLGWAQGSTPTRTTNPYLRPPRRPADLPTDPLESPVR